VAEVTVTPDSVSPLASSGPKSKPNNTDSDGCFQSTLSAAIIAPDSVLCLAAAVLSQRLAV
jgi:hypothetical protein